MDRQELSQLDCDVEWFLSGRRLYMVSRVYRDPPSLDSFGCWPHEGSYPLIPWEWDMGEGTRTTTYEIRIEGDRMTLRYPHDFRRSRKAVLILHEGASDSGFQDVTVQFPTVV